MNKRQAKIAALDRIIQDIQADIDIGGAYSGPVSELDAEKIIREMHRIMDSLRIRLYRLQGYL